MHSRREFLEAAIGVPAMAAVLPRANAMVQPPHVVLQEQLIAIAPMLWAEMRGRLAGKGIHAIPAAEFAEQCRPGDITSGRCVRVVGTRYRKTTSELMNLDGLNESAGPLAYAEDIIRSFAPAFVTKVLTQTKNHDRSVLGDGDLFVVVDEKNLTFFFWGEFLDLCTEGAE